jgi:glycosyltransferase involved in cell wall biosynthesis
MTKIENKKIILQVIPAMEMGGAEIGTVEISTYMKKKGWKVIITSSGGSLVNKLDYRKIKHIKLPLNSKNPLIIFFNIFKLAWIIKKYKVKIVHVRSRAPAWSAYYACSMIRGVKLVSTIHGAYSNQNIFKNFYNSVMLNSVKIIAISKYIKNYLLQNYNLTKKKRDKIVVIPRGVDPTKFSPQNIDSKRLFFLTNHWELPDGVPIILFPSRIAPFKGHKTLLKALAILKKETKIKFICLMVGLSKKNSNYDAEIKSFIDENDLSDYIKFTGACSDMPAAYKISDIVVSPADKPEGFGRIIIESQSMERPVIASAHGGSLELIKNNFSGILFKPKNERDLADKLKYLICLSREKKEKIIMNANALVSEKYDIEKMYDLNFKLYSSLIK